MSVVAAILGLAAPLAWASESRQELSLSPSSWDRLGKVLSIRSDRAQCSASLIRLAGGCVLISNSHCAPSGASHLELQIPPNAILERVDPSVQSLFETSKEITNDEAWLRLPVQVIKRSQRDDLIQLKVPELLQSKACLSLQSLSAPDPLSFLDNRVKAVTALGFVNQAPIARFTSEISWERGWGASQFSMVPYAGPAGSWLIEMSQVHVSPGMSGGLMVDNWGSVVGITSQFVPFQFRAFAIPLQVVERFLRETPKEPALAVVDSRSITAAHIFGQSNSNVIAGNNSHGDGGNNSHGDGGLVDRRFAVARPLDLFREPNEGYVLEGDPSVLLLGADGHQIDGFDDYTLWYLERKGTVRELITRRRDSYPDQQVREGLLSRLHGHYGFGGKFRENRSVIFASEPSVSEGWVPALQGGDAVWIEVDARKSKLKLALGEHDLVSGTALFADVRVPGELIEFDVRYEDQAKKVVLKSPLLELQCDNRHFLKLICNGNNIEFSITVNETYSKKVQRQLRFRVAKQLELSSLSAASGRKWIIYRYGDLVDEGTLGAPSFWRGVFR